MSRAAFEKILIQQASPESLETDRAGAWENVYQYVLPARALDRGLYERALLKLEDSSFGCASKWKEEAARLSCAANNAANVASSLTAFDAAVEFRQDAVAYAERIADRDPAPLLDALIDLAEDEQAHGSLAEVERIVGRADALVTEKLALLDRRRSLRLAVMKARLADARLDDAAALQALADAVMIMTASTPAKALPSDSDQIDVLPFSDLVELHLRGRFCQTCGRPIAEPVRTWMDAVLNGRVDGSAGVQKDVLLLALSATADAFSKAQLKAFSRRYLKQYAEQGPGSVQELRLLPATMDEVSAARLMALASIITDGSGTAKGISFLREPDERRQSVMGRALLKELISSSYEQFGADSVIAAKLDSLSRTFQAFGLRSPARLTLEFLMDRLAAGGGDLSAEKFKLANIYVPALARLASMKIAGGDRAAALRYLDEAGAIATSKLREEWKLGGAAAILAIRDLAPALKLIAQKRSEVVAPSGVSRNAEGHDALFRAMQAAMFGETALTVEVANQRRLLADDVVRDLRRRHLSAVADSRRQAGIGAMTTTVGDVDGAFARTRKSAEDRRDALALEVQSRLPNAFSDAADIEPVGIAQARAHLGTGEALVLLHVGSHGIYGFLVDGKGRSSTWRSVIRREAVEGLVRSVRAGGDVSRGVFPLFPFADAARLHDLIFGPVKGELGAYRKLVIVGDGPLQAMPYGVLLTDPAIKASASPEALRAAAPPWLIRSHALALMPSVRSLIAQRSVKAASRAPKPFLGIGNPQLADASGGTRSIDVVGAFGASKNGLADVSMLRRLVSLPETADELRAIATLLNAPVENLMLGGQAKESAIRKMALGDYKIVAFATHGALAGEVTGTSEPGLVLTPPAEASREDDGFLALSEIAGLQFDADLVMLSACNTAASDGRPRAEGLSGLARGFFNAGARSLLVTHWAIPSESSVKVTTGLVARRTERPDADWADALREATLAVMDREGPSEWAHPAYWAGFAVIGVLPMR